MPRHPIGTRLRRYDGTLYHVRGFVDQRYVLRTWDRALIARNRLKWRYEVLTRKTVETAFKPELK